MRGPVFKLRRRTSAATLLVYTLFQRSVLPITYYRTGSPLSKPFGTSILAPVVTDYFRNSWLAAEAAISQESR